MFELIPYVPKSIWNKGKLVGQKLPLKLEEIGSDYSCLIICEVWRCLILLLIVN